ncbi:MAG: general secretion pathway protein GspB [Desulfuromonadales bacterium]
MSSILKALKKLENDKAARRQDALKIDAEILRPDNSPRLSPAGILVICLLLVAGGSGATYMYMRRDKAPDVTQVGAGAVMSRQNPPPVSAVPDIKTERLPADRVVPAAQTKPVKAETPKPGKPPAPASTPPAAIARPVAAPKRAEQSKPPLSPPPLSASVKTVPALRVNGIAFQHGSADSVAMINGVPVSSGSEIEGVKIEEIHKNRVEFSYNGEKFEIQLGQSNR